MNEINIDEENLREAPSGIARIKYGVISVFLGAIFAQVIAWTFGFRSIVLWYDTIPFIMYVTACGLIGGIGGEKFIHILKAKIVEWFSVLNRWI